MTHHRDAVDYLLELRDTRNEPWFSKLCDLAITAGGDEVAEDDLDSLQNLFLSGDDYTPAAARAGTATAALAEPPSHFLDRMRGFQNFKRLGDSLELVFDKRITIVFGKNGSGKSSLCQAFEVLANAERPTAPLKNVRQQHTSDPAFEYTFRDADATTWNETAGFGLEADKLVYFDATVALTHLEEPMDPSRSVLLTPFRLEVFEYAGDFVSKVQEKLRAHLQLQEQTLTTVVQTFITKLGDIANPESDPFASLLQHDATALESLVAALPEIDEAHAAELQALADKQKQLTEAGSETGLTALRARKAACTRLKQFVNRFVSDMDNLRLPFRIEQESKLAQKQAALNELLSRCFPKDQETTGLQQLVEAAAEVTDLEKAAADDNACPLCQRVHDQDSAERFHAYHKLLTNELLEEARELQAELGRARTTINEMTSREPEDYTILQDDLPEGQPEAVLAAIKVVTVTLPSQDALFNSYDVSGLEPVEAVRAFSAIVEDREQALAEAVKSGEEGGEELATQLQQVEAELAGKVLERELYAEKATAEILIEQCKQHREESAQISGYGFPALRSALSNKRKEANEGLVMSSFEGQLDDEYKRLSGVSMEQFGVQLNPVAAQQNVLVRPQVGGDRVKRVLSEGEQKIHALAAFFCEASQSPHRVMVFDDPVTSFDYNYISNFCRRIRDYANTHNDAQLIVLTHNWDFFINLQQELKQGGLENHYAINVLESCRICRVYEEKESTLITEIEQLIGGPGEPTDAEKDHAMGLMRRLIEVVVNTYVFANQRHQYKQRTLQVSTFREFRKIVPLDGDEPQRLGDLYRDLCPPEHDDIRTFYTDRTADRLRGWLQDIKDIRDEIKTRQP